MTDDSTPRFDPRFDPAFQPGYDPDVSSAGSGAAANSGRYPKRLTPPPVVPAAAPRVSLTTGNASSAASYSSASASSSGIETSPVRARPRYSGTPNGAPGTAPASATSSPQPQPPAAVAPVPLPAQFDTGFDEPDQRGIADGEASAAQQLLRNPFLVALSILAVVFVAVGAWLFNRSYEAYNDAGNFASQGDFVAVEAAINVAPLFVLFGAAIAVGVLFIFAIRWRRP